MAGIEMEEVHEALLDAYDEASLEQMLEFRLDKGLFKIVGHGAFEVVAFNVLKKARQQGWYTDLVKQAYRFNPGNDKMQSVYEKYGLAPNVKVIDGKTEPKVATGKASAKGLEKIIRPDIPGFDIAKLSARVRQWEVRVCRIDRNNVGLGTGFLVGPDLVLTNYHVMERAIKGEIPVSSFTCRFDYKILADNSTQEGTIVKLHADPKQAILLSSPYTPEEAASKPDDSVPTEKQLDYALLRLERAMGKEPESPGAMSPKRGWEVLPASAITFAPDGGIIIVQHPAAEPMKVAIDTQSLLDPPTNSGSTRVRYRTNTEGGSSGSPVFTMACELAALHHYGDPAFTADPTYNQGVIPLHVIRQQIVDAGFGELLGS